MRNISCIFLKVIGKRTLKPYQLDIFTHDYNHNILLSDITFLCFISKCNRISGYLIRQANHFFKLNDHKKSLRPKYDRSRWNCLVNFLRRWDTKQSNYENLRLDGKNNEKASV